VAAQRPAGRLGSYIHAQFARVGGVELDVPPREDPARICGPQRVIVLDTNVQIAGICRQHGATLATRNTHDFVGTGVDLVDPWTAG